MCFPECPIEWACPGSTLPRARSGEARGKHLNGFRELPGSRGAPGSHQHTTGRRKGSPRGMLSNGSCEGNMTIPESIIPRADLPALGPDATAIVRENIGIVMTYAFSKKALEGFRSRHHGDWGGLDHVVFELPERRGHPAFTPPAAMLQ